MSTPGCAACREFLLSADPEQLRAPHEFREHLEECLACGRAAAAILARNRALDDALATLSEDHAGVAVPPPLGGLRRRLPALATLAAAAAILLLVWQQAPRAVVPPAPLALPKESVPASPVVNATGASGVAVMATNNPDITVVWTF